ncbi:MAG: hypothetical protein H9872_07850 [Candidatus Cellulosilyticum pullistercoris]|uniref:Uncharacterized protein n=1 Tax=Candidatus Cellulosilyticum pullistercoris TaxID=2838521 RepID=A0A9E2KBX3_9FIRM|nr:hypothetical protein [Candidatus Cellulosilyticum pullistercoris]
MSYWGLVGSLLLNATSNQQVNSSGFPVAAAVVLIGLIIAVVIWDIIKARRETQWTDEIDEKEDRS